MARFTISKKDGTSETVEANSPQEAYQLVMGKPLAQGAAVPVPTPKAGMPAPAPGLVPAPAMGGPTGEVMSPEQQREALLNLLPVLGGLLAPMLGPELAAGSGLMRLAPLASGALNAAVGGAGGQAVGDVTRAATGAETAPASLGEAAQRAGEAGVEQAGQEVVGRGVGRVAGGLAKGAKHLGVAALGKAESLPFANRVTDLGRQVIETAMSESSRYEPILAPLAKRLGIGATPEAAMKLPLGRVANVTASKSIDLLTKISESAPLSGFEVAVKNFGSGGGSAIVKQIADDFGKYAQPNELGESLLLSNWDLVQAHKLAENKTWNYLLGSAAQGGGKPRMKLGPGGLVPIPTRQGVRVPVSNLARLVAPLRAAEAEIQKIGSKTDAGGIADAIQAMVEEGPDISFGAAKLLRSRLGAEADRITTLVGGPAPAKATVSRLRKQLDKEMRKALGEQAPQLLPIFETANRLTTERARELQNPLVQKLTEKVTQYTEQGIPVFKGPLGEIPSTVLTGPGGAGKVEQFRSTVSPQKFDELANSWVQWQLAAHPGESVSSIGMKLYDGKGLQESFAADGPNGELLAALFKTRPGNLDRLRKWTDVLASTQLRPGEGGQLGTLAIMQTQWGAIGVLTGGALTGLATGTPEITLPSAIGAGAVILTPPLVSRFMNSPLGYQMLTRSVGPAATAREGAKLASKIALQAEKFKAGLSAVERAYSDNVEMQIRQQAAGAAEPAESATEPLPPPTQAQPTPLAAAG